MNDDKLNSIFVFTGSMIFMTGLRAGRIYFTKSSFVASFEIYKKKTLKQRIWETGAYLPMFYKIKLVILITTARGFLLLINIIRKIPNWG